MHTLNVYWVRAAEINAGDPVKCAFMVNNQ